MKTPARALRRGRIARSKPMVRHLYTKRRLLTPPSNLNYTVPMPPKVTRTLTIAQSNKSAIPLPLRFYDPELQEACNAEPFDLERLERARARSQQLHKSYLSHIQTLAGRMSKETFRRFSDPNKPLFDADRLEFAFGDSLAPSLKGPRPRPKLTVKASLRSFDGKTLHTLSYKRIASLNVSIPPARWFDWGDGRIDSLLADELTDVDGIQMQHTFLFVSGTVISIQFGSVMWNTTRTV